MYYTNGHAAFADAEGVLTWVSTLTLEEADAFSKKVKESYQQVLIAQGLENMDKAPVFSREYEKTHFYNFIHNNIDLSTWVFCGKDWRKEHWEGEHAKTIEKYKTFVTYAVEFGQRLVVTHWMDGVAAYVYLGNKSTGIVVPEPEKHLTYIPAADYSQMTPEQVRLALKGDAGKETGIMPLDAQAALTRENIAAQQEAEQAELNDVKAKIEDVRNAASGELAELKKEIEAMERKLREKKEAQLAELDEKKASLEIKLEKFGTQLYMLEAQIYAIECYAGETITFSQIRSGKNAPNDSPLIIHQKFRFLDEELGKLASLYEIQWDEMEMFEKFLRHHPLALDTFAPDERCVVIVRLSKTNTTIGTNTKYPYENLLATYEYYHGTTVGIIIRNGENLYLGWIDDGKVSVSDNLVFGKDSVIQKPVQETPPAFESETERLKYVKKHVRQAKAYTDEIIKRVFLFNILQGVIDHSNLLPMPEEVNLMKPSPYYVFSMADNWLKDTRFGSFTEIMERCQGRIQKNDAILTTQRLVASRNTDYSGRWLDQSWHNDRGRGERNRTHDVQAQDNTIYPVNLVEYDKPKKRLEYRWRWKPESCLHNNAKGPDEWKTASTEKFEEKDGKFVLPNFNYSDCEFEAIRTYEHTERHLFISLKKTESGSWWDRETGQNARANFELYDGEYITLTFLNSVWLEWVVNNRELGGWRIKGETVSYAYGIKYLKNALEFVKKREVEEKKLIDAVDSGVCNDPEWPLKLSEWKLEHDVHRMTEYQAKRFVKAVKNG